MVPFAFFDEIFETCASICGGCFSSETDSQGSQDGRFSGSVMTDDEIDSLAKVDFQTFMTLFCQTGFGGQYHEIE